MKEEQQPEWYRNNFPMADELEIKCGELVVAETDGPALEPATADELKILKPRALKELLEKAGMKSYGGKKAMIKRYLKEME